MKRSNHLFPQVCAFENLMTAAYKAVRGKKHKPAVAEFYFNLEAEIIHLQNQLQQGLYQPKPYYCFQIHEPKPRYICAADIRDRVVHHALCNILEPIFEKIFIYDSYACRKSKGPHQAIRRLRTFSQNQKYFLKADIQKFFASIDHAVLKKLLKNKIKDHKLINLMDIIIDHRVPGYKPGKGLAIGNLTSQWWANFYLNSLDHYLKDDLGYQFFIRYMDDFIVLRHNKEDLHIIVNKIEKFINTELKLKFNTAVTRVSGIQQGIPFLGFRVFPGLIRLNHASMTRFRRQIRKKENAYLKNYLDEDGMIRSTAAILAHIKHADTYHLRKKFLTLTDLTR